MSRLRPLIIVVVLIGAGVLAWFLLSGSSRPRTLSGYIEGEELYLAAPMAGTIASISAVEGQRVAAGQPLFRIDPATLAAQAQQADADVAAAAADATKARQDLARLLSVKHDDSAAVANKDIDAARAALNQANARVAAAQKTAQARRAQVAASRAQTAQAQGGQREVAIRVNQLSPPAPSPALVEDVFYQPGEWVNANQPVVALIPDNKIKVRFYVPEQEVARYRPGRTIRFACDACAGGLSARIAYVSPRPEFTPPVIFSRDSRDRLVFMVEAYPTQPTRLMPGLPVDVEPLP